MSFRFFFVICCSVVTFSGLSQDLNDAVLFTIDSNAVKATEFIRVYKKNLNLVQDDSQKDIDNYLNLFIDYKLKVQEARAEGLDQKPSYLRELRTYTEQLAKNYMTNSKVTDALVEEAYNRISQELNADHILIRLSGDASPQDTIMAYKKISALRDRAVAEGFETVRNDVHNGKTIFGEKLGYFSGFKMVYPFETAAYNTEIGAISQPFRTNFGYHIVKVNDKRPARGKVSVAHIMLLTNKSDSLNASQELKINDIYSKLKNGASFEALAKQFSEDKNTAPNGGVLSAFSSGQLSAPEFEDAAFALENPGDISEPVKSKFGWHLIKLIQKEPVQAFDKMKPELIERIKRDGRSKVLDDALHIELRERYKVSSNAETVNYFSNLIKSSTSKKIDLPESYERSKPLFTLGDRTYTYRDFGMYLETYGLLPETNSNPRPLVEDLYNKFLNTKLVSYHKSNLVNINPEYANILQEYKEGLLLFDLMDSKIWKLSKSDSTGLENFYKNHLDKYKTPKQIDAILARSSNQKALKKVAKLWHSGMALDDVKTLVNNPNTPDVEFRSGLFSLNDEALPKNLNIKTGLSKVLKENNAYVLVFINEVIPAKTKPLEAIRGLVQSDYQAEKEKQWLAALDKKYKVTINKDVLEAIKTQLQAQ